jgi:hypothetical protein
MLEERRFSFSSLSRALVRKCLSVGTAHSLDTVLTDGPHTGRQTVI